MLERDVMYGLGGEVARGDLDRVYHLLEQEEARRAEGARIRARVPNFEEKEPGIAYINKVEKSRTGRNLIYALRDNQDRVRVGTRGVLDVAHCFYTDLFTSEETDEQVQDDILDSLTLTLSEGSRDMCDA